MGRNSRAAFTNRALIQHKQKAGRGGSRLGLRTRSALAPFGMFAGYIDQQTIISDQPVLVVDGEAVLSSFSRVHEAETFLQQSKSDTALIFRHNGHNWDICPAECPSNRP